MDNYRGIDISSTFGKVLDLAAITHSIDYLAYTQSELQFGFTPQCSPYFATVLMTESIAESHDLDLDSYVCSLDTKKAFDVVSHKALFTKLYDYGVDPFVLSYFISTFSAMKSSVKWGNFIPPPFSCNSRY